MPLRSPTPMLAFAAFALGIEAVIGAVLSLSTGLAELHKTVLVIFLTGFPILSLLIFIPLAAWEASDSETPLWPFSFSAQRRRATVRPAE